MMLKKCVPASASSGVPTMQEICVRRGYFVVEALQLLRSECSRGVPRGGGFHVSRVITSRSSGVMRWFTMASQLFWDSAMPGVTDAQHSQIHLPNRPHIIIRIFGVMRKSQVFLYPLESRVAFPYHEYQVSLVSNQFDSKDYDNLIGFVTKLDSNQPQIEKVEGISKYGTLMKIYRESVSDFLVKDRIKVNKLLLIGLTFARFKVISVVKKDVGYLATIEIMNDQVTKDIQAGLVKKKLFDRLKIELKTFYECTLRQGEADVKKIRLESETKINKLVFTTIGDLDLSTEQALEFLQVNSLETRINMLVKYIVSKTEGLKGIKEIEEKVRQDIFKNTHTTRNNSTSSRGEKKLSDTDKLRKRMEEKDLPENVKEEIDKEMESISANQSQNKDVTVRYLETLLDVPWKESTEDNTDIKRAASILDAGHTGLEKVKERILEFLAVRFRGGNTKGNVLCLCGPPGVGKTSIVKSIAEAMGRKFARISLGGVTDEAELRGHRRTYVAALPGVIMRTLIKTKSNNPVILLDEVEKMGKSYKGDPAHVLLEVLDPSQNSSFVDHYVAMPYDLSKVLFICTANSTDEMSHPLLNRLQIINLSGYTKQEKFDIAIKHVIPEQIKENAVSDILTFEDEAVKEIVEHSDEMGVRMLERNVGKICRKIAYKNKKTSVTRQTVLDLLGPTKDKKLWNGVGIVKGLAWTAYGGKVLMVEAVKSTGKGKIEITGQLGDVMKESVNIAFSWIKSNLPVIALLNQTPTKDLMRLESTLQELQKINIHIHFPEGSVKKDGPSAGVTIATCLTSLLIGIKPKESLAMTGEISLTGQVLPVGGIREKVTAAINKGIKEIILPFGNEHDLQEVPEEYRKKVKFHPVHSLDEVLRVAFSSNKALNLTPKF